MTRAELERIRDLAIGRLTTGDEPPWVWYQLMKLREASEALLAGLDATQPTAGLRAEATRQGAGLRLVGSTDQLETAQRRQGTEPVQLPT